MYRYRTYLFSLLMLVLLIPTGCARNGPQPQQAETKDAAVNVEADPVQAALKERAEQATKGLARQKEVKAAITELPVLEQFTRETLEKDVVAKLGEPVNIRDLKMEKTEQKVYYYDKSKKFAVWFWREKDDSGPYQFRAALSLNHGRFDVPLHNVLTEDELRRVMTLLDTK